MLQLGGEEDVTAHQQPGLLAALEIARAQMHVEEMNNLPRCDLQIAADAAAGLAGRSGKVVDPNLLYRKAAEHHVAVHRATQLARLTDAMIVVTCRVSQILRLVLF